MPNSSHPPSPGSLQLDASFLFLLVAVGTAFNLLIPLLLLRRSPLRTSSNLVIVNLALADLLVTGYIVPVVIANRLVGRNALGPVACRVNSLLVFMAMGVSNASIMLIALDRYCVIFHRHFHDTHVTRRAVLLVLVATWLLWLLYALALFLIFRGFEYEPDAFVCFFDSHSDMGYALLLTFFDFLLPLLILVLCYSVIVARIFRTKVKLTQHGVAQARSYMARFKQELVMLLTVCLTVCLFVVCWGPFMFHGYWIRAGADISPLIHKMLCWLALSNSALNGVIYSLLHTQFRSELKKWFWRSSEVQPFGPSVNET